MKILSVNTGRAAALTSPSAGGSASSASGSAITSAIAKSAVYGRVNLGKLGLEGDEQVDLSTHGGPDKAVYAYPAEHYEFWREHSRRALKFLPELPHGSMGENLTIQGLLEAEVWIGDRLHVGNTILQVTGPRPPCFKFGIRMGYAHAVKLMVQSGYTGFYLRVLQTGSVHAGDTIAVQAGPRQISVSRQNEVLHTGHQRALF